MDLLKVNFVEKETNLLFVLLLTIPISVVSISLVCVIFLKKKSLLNSVVSPNIKKHEYMKLLSDEVALDAEEERGIATSSL